MFADKTLFKEESILIFPHETDEHLEANSTTSLDTVLNDFQDKGGTLIRLDGDSKPFTLMPDDVVFPSCTGGNNRSQTVWAILSPYAHSIKLNPPHSTRNGFDPYNGLENWRTNNPSGLDEFKQWCGFSKQTKFGWDVFFEKFSKQEASTADLKAMRDYYDAHYYHPVMPSSTRRIYITFMKNAHVHLYRLTETNQSLKDVIILFFPLEDFIHNPKPEWNTYPRSEKAYTEFSELVNNYLDLSQL